MSSVSAATAPKMIQSLSYFEMLKTVSGIFWDPELQQQICAIFDSIFRETEIKSIKLETDGLKRSIRVKLAHEYIRKGRITSLLAPTER